MNFLNKEWGRRESYSRSNDLMRVTGFDQDTQSYNYRVQGVSNPRINGTPWRLQLGVKYNFN